MPMDVQARYKKLAKQCGVYPIARKMCKEGHSIEVALRILVGRK